MEVEGIRLRGRPKKTWWDCVKNDMESLGLSQKDAQSRNKWRRRIKGQPANPGSRGKMAVKTESVCVWSGLWTVALCAAETWTLTQIDRRREETFEMWSWRRMEKFA